MPETRYALLIGNRYYPFDERLVDLRAAEHDVDGLAEVLSNPHLGRFEAVTRLKNPVHSDVLEALWRVCDVAQQDSLVCVYFSGYVRFDEQGRLYLAVMNTQPALLEATSIAVERLKACLDNSRATRIMLLLDWCVSEVDRDYAEPDGIETAMRLLSGGRGKYILTAATAPEAAQYKQADTYSALTKYLIEGIKTGQADTHGRGTITIDHLYQYVTTKVRAETHYAPRRWDLNSQGELIVAWTSGRPHEVSAATAPAIRARYDAIIQMFKKGEVILFLGPGVVEQNAADRPPAPEELAQRLARGMGFAANAEPLTLVSQKLHIVAGRGVVYDNLREIYRPQPYAYSPALTHRFLASLPHPLLILSTAYDTLLEEAFDHAGKPYALVTHILHAESEADRGKVIVQYSTQKEKAQKCLSDELVIDLSQWSVIYKINGTFGLCDPESEEEIDSIVISEEDYIALIRLLDNPQTTIPNQLARQFKKRMFLFLGYRMSDWNFRAVVDVIHRKGNFRRIQPYAVRPEAVEFERLYWESKQVRLIETDLALFIRDLAEAMGIRL